MSLFRLLAWIGFFAFLFGVAKIAGASLGDVNDPGSLVLFALGTLVILALTFAPSEWRLFRYFLLSPRRLLSPNERRRVETFCRSGARTAWAVGAFISLFQLIVWVRDLPNAKVAPVISVAVIPLLYSLVIAEFLFIPLATRARRARMSD